MLEFLNNKYFVLAIIPTIVQQIFVALSTYIIGLTGKNITKDIELVRYYLIIFFLLIGCAYIFGSFSYYFRQKHANSAWLNYSIGFFKTLGHNLKFATKANKANTNTFITAEAMPLYEKASFLVVDIVSIFCNIIFNLIAFYFILTPLITISIFASIIISFVLLWLLRTKIKTLADDMQSNKVKALNSMRLIWNNLFYGNSLLYKQSQIITKKKAFTYFLYNEKYKMLEQAISCTPIFLGIIFILIAILMDIENYNVSLGALAATLPRSLQLFQNVHASNMYFSQFMLLKRKLDNLASFSSQLEFIDYDKLINKARISVYEINTNPQEITLDNFLSKVLNNSISNGRYLVKGDNGVGKTSLLKVIKSAFPEAIMVEPGILFDIAKVASSTGEIQKKMLTDLLALNPLVLLLDEWNANLDTNNTNLINGVLDRESERRLIIEVRHE